MRVVEVPVGTLGIDTAATLTAKNCIDLKAAGIKFVIRYLPELDKPEIDAIFAAGLGLMLVAHVRYAGWQPSMAMGAGDAERVARRAQALGVPPNATIWCDLEGMSGSTSDTVDYTNAWAAMLKTFHYEPGAYVGAGIPLDSMELYRKLNVSRYWRSQSAVPTPVVRGYQMYQLFSMPTGSMKLCGIDVDVDITQHDYKGGCPTMIVP